MTIPPPAPDGATPPGDGPTPRRARVLLAPPPAVVDSPQSPAPVELPAPAAPPPAPALAPPPLPPAALPASADPVRGAWLGGAALLLAFAGEGLLFDEARRLWGALALLLAMALGALAWGATPDRAPLAAGAAGWRRIAWRRALFWRLGGIAVSALLAAGAVRANMTDPTAIFGAQGGLWLAGMALLLLACARWYPRSAPDAGAGPAWTRREAVLFVALIALSLATRLAFLDEIPWRFHFDEGYAFTETMRFYRGPMIPLFTTTWHETSLPSLWFAFAAGMMRFTGVNLGGVRLAEAFIGAVTVIPVYGLARLSWGRMAAALAAFSVAVSAVYIHYSRVSIINVSTAFAWLVCYYFLLRGLRSRRPGDFVWAGLAAGASMYTFYGARLLPYLLVAFVAYLLIFHWRATRERLGHLALLPLGFLAGFGPLLGYFLLHPEMWTSRALTKMNVPPEIPTSWDAVVRDWNILAPYLWQNVLGLSVVPGRDTVYYAPFLLGPEAALLALGVALLIRRWRQPAAFLLLLTGAGVVLAGGTLIEGETIPNFAHWTPAFPVFYLALALPLACWLTAVRRADRLAWRLARIAVAAALLWDGAANLYGYLVDYPPLVAADHSLEAVQGRFLESLGPNVDARIVGVTWQGLNTEVAAMMAPDVAAYDLINPSRELPLVTAPGRDQVFVFYNDQWPAVPLVQSYYPGGVSGAIGSPADPHVAETYRVPAALVAAAHGVQVSVSAPDAADSAPAQAPLVGALPAGAALSYPAVVTWSGQIYFPAGPAPRLAVQGAPGARLWVEGQEAQGDAPLDVDPGWARFVVQARLDAPAPLRLVMPQAGGAAPEVPRDRLWPAPPDQGLAVTLGGAGGAVRHRIDAFIGARALRAGLPTDPAFIPLASPRGPGAAIRWEGEVAAPVAGRYTMALRTDAQAQLSIDGQPVATHCAAQFQSPPTTGPVDLAPGWHHVRIDLLSSTDGLEWLWTRPDGKEETVPPATLRLAGGAVGPIAWPDPAAAITCP
jgi:hypothetical protein